MFVFSYLSLVLTIFGSKIFDKKIIDYNICTESIKTTDIYNSIILCKDINIKLIESIKQKNIIYTYEDTILSPYNYNFLLIYLSNKYDYPIVTSKYNYFKPFQYNTQDILLMKIKDIDDKFILTKKNIIKNSKHFFIESNHSQLFIRL